MQKLRILYLENSDQDVDILQSLLSEDEIPNELIHCRSRESFLTTLRQEDFDVILAGITLSDIDGLEALDLARQILTDIPFIIISGIAGEEQAIEALKRGATDYVLKQRINRIIPAITRALLERQEKDHRIHAESQKQKYDFIVNASKSMFSLVDANFTYEAVNDAFCRAHKLMREEIIGKTLMEIWGKDTFEQFIKPNFDQSFSDNIVRYQSWFEVPHQGMRCFEVTFYPYKEAGSDVTHTVVDTMDITEKQHALEAMQESEERYRMLFDHATEAIFLQRDGIVQTCNARALALFGYTAEELKEGDVFRHSPESQPDGSRSADRVKDFYRSADQGESLEFQWRFEGKDQTGFLADVSLTSFQLKGQTFFQFFIRDITEESKMKEYLRHVQKMETIGTLAGGIAHDFNNIIATILGHTDMALQDVGIEHQAHEDLEQIRKASQRAKGLVNQILTFSRQVDAKPEMVNMESLAQESIRLLGASVPNSIEVETDLGSPCCGVLADPSQMHQVIMNICTNAIYSMKESGGTLSIRSQCIPGKELKARIPTLKAEHYSQLEFIDTGPGMDADVKERIFEPFFTTKPVGEGTGLGLSVVHGIVKNLSGEILVESEPGKGACFTLLLPCLVE